jgi:type II secretory pathway component PulF
MPSFVYRAKDGPSRTVEGEVRAATRAEALARVDAMGLSPVSVEEKEAAPSRPRALLSRRAT